MEQKEGQPLIPVHLPPRKNTQPDSVRRLIESEITAVRSDDDLPRLPKDFSFNVSYLLLLIIIYVIFVIKKKIKKLKN